MLRDIAEGVAGLVGLFLGLATMVLSLAFGSGIVREHCLDVETSQAIGGVNVDTKWTYILWPPLPFASLDPPGRCVRNQPGREALDYVGVWELGEPEEQVREHAEEQVRDRREP